MSEYENYWTRRVSRRTALRGAAFGTAGLAGAALIGCGEDEPDATAEPTTAPPAGGGGGTQATATAEATTAPPPSTAGEIDTEATLTVGYGSFASSLDTQTAAGSGGQAASNSYHFGGLLATKKDSSAGQGGIADFEWREDNFVLRFKIKPGVKFHNGADFNAEQLKFNYDRGLGRAEYNPDFVGSQSRRQQWIGEITIVDDLTVDVRMADQPFRNAPQESSVPPVEMDYILSEGDEAQAQHPISTGPMIFESWIPDSEIVSVRNEDFPFPRDDAATTNKTKPWIKRLVGKFIPEEQARFAALEAGEVDVVNRVGPDLALAFKDREGFKFLALPDQRVMSIELPINADVDPITGGPNPWRDIRVRQAANYAIDTDSIINNLLTGNEERAYSPFPRGGYPLPLGNLEQPYYYDPERARALLEDAGQVGFQFEILLPQGLWTADRLWMPAVQKMLNDVGFVVTVKYTPLSEALAQQRSRAHKGPYIFNQGSTKNGAAFKSADTAYGLIATKGAAYSHTDEGDNFLPEYVEFHDLVDAARREFDEKPWRDLFWEAAVVHYQNAFNVPMFHLSHLYVMRDNIEYTEFFEQPASMNFMNARKLLT